MNRRHRLPSRLGLLLALMGIAACASSGPQPPIVGRQPAGLAAESAGCFPVESLTAADRTLREAAAPIYKTYTERRPRYIREDSTGAVALWRAWLTDARH